jgi:hypothetical protein
MHAIDPVTKAYQMSNLLYTVSVACSIGAKLHMRQAMFGRASAGRESPAAVRLAAATWPLIERWLTASICLDQPPGPLRVGSENAQVAQTRQSFCVATATCVISPHFGCCPAFKVPLGPFAVRFTRSQI